MVSKWLYTMAFLVLGTVGLHAQDGRDSLMVQPMANPSTGITVLPPVSFSSMEPLFPPLYPVGYESKEQRSMRINRETFRQTMEALNRNLAPHRPPHYSQAQKMLLLAAKLFLSDPKALPKDAVPVMNASQPFIYVITPGMKPYEHLYSADRFPQAIRPEFDLATGQYRMVMVPWDEFQRNLARSLGGGPVRMEPVPKMRLSSADDILR